MALTKITRELLNTGIDDNSNATAITIDSSENVGIGITSSLEKFTVSNSSSGIVGRFTNNTNQTLDLGVISGSGAAGGVYYNSANSGYHAFQVGGNQKMRLDSDGNLGMGTNPATGVRLDIRNDSTTTLADFRNANSSGYGLYVAGGSSSSQYALRAADKDNNALFSVLSDGSVTKPKQPAFLARLSGFQSNVSNTAYSTVIFDTEIFDQNADFSTSTYKFTAPVTGRYQFNVSLRLQELDNTADYSQVRLTTSNRNYEVFLLDTSDFAADLNYHTASSSHLVDMDANDVAFVQIRTAGGAAKTDISYSGDSNFSGFLAC